MVEDHSKANDRLIGPAQLLECEIGSGQDVELKTFASEILPIVLEHLQIAKDVQAQLTGSAS